MFNRKLKERVSKLESNLEKANEEILKLGNRISSLRWEMDNPPKFQIGEKIGKFTIHKRRKDEGISTYWYCHWVYDLISCTPPSIIVRHEFELIKEAKELEKPTK